MEDTMEKWLAAEMERRRPTFNPEVINDMIDAYMTTDQKGAMAKDHFVRVLVDLFIGAIDTTSTAIGWTLYYLAQMPGKFINLPAINWYKISFLTDEQERLYKHIESVVPANAYPSLEHKDLLPRVEALINEVHRYGNMTMIGNISFPLPFYTAFLYFHFSEKGMPRCSHTEEISFEVKNKRYTVPVSGSIWFTNYISQHDERYWRDANNFRVDRWLNAEGKLVNHSHWFQFGIGRRACPGEQVGRNLFFLYVTFLIQRFRWRQATNYGFDEYEMRLTKLPPPKHQLIFTKRE